MGQASKGKDKSGKAASPHRSMTVPQPKHHEHDHRSDHEREESGDDPARHASIIARRWLGSDPPTPERYARALQQWQALPGSVARPAAAVVAAAEKLEPEGENKP